MPRLAAREVLATVLDEGTFISWDSEPQQPDLGEEYSQLLARAAVRAGVDEAVMTGEGQLAGRRVAVVVSDFAFLAGSVGAAASERITAAFERATAEGLAMLASPSSGGTRMQEGTPAFLQMVKIGQAVAAHKAAGLPYLVYLRDPTTGGVLASWGSLGHLSIAEPGALIGFLGPRVREVLVGAPFPDGVQVAENLATRGVIDGVLPVDQVRAAAIDALDVLQSPQQPIGEHHNEPDADVLASRDAWGSVQATRRAHRPGLRELLRHAAEAFIPLRGTSSGESDLTVIMGLARFQGFSCVLVGQDRQAQQNSYLGPAGLRVAQRGIALAEELGLPLMTVVDTPGAELSAEAEHGGMAGEIARCLAALATVEVPVVSVILGEGSGGGALALMPADRTVCAEHGWIAPLPPEGASAIVHRTGEQAPQMAELHRIRAIDLRSTGVVDEIVPEYPDAADEPEAFCLRIAAVCGAHVRELLTTPTDVRLKERHRRYRHAR
ncbi:acetyl-CoA carboxyl transferase [Ornithinimicrobium ciconiae]|uniref:Acetyl-CoA carboxyl transferase n=1 Tax=Ornithinimicrobium ciconiae TaxID=2594265 RepID=A0A516GE65_9MICO|nr:carboxyl transferase domain-containing protein [Ornithinimicrobium ciconiae]QDO89827.1 acetyl-CoA carboxyl transferase [Ornithinimicrobium ciconiae]